MLSTFAYPIAQNYSLPETQFACLNLSSQSIYILGQIHIKLRFISSLYLDNNLIQSLKGIQNFMNLQLLSVNFNFIQQKEQFLALRNKFLLTNISFIGNKVQKHATDQWLKQSGFYNLKSINQIKEIGKNFDFDSSKLIKINRSNQINQTQRRSIGSNKKKQSRQNFIYLKKSNQKNNWNREDQKDYEYSEKRDQVYLTKRREGLSSTKQGRQLEQTMPTKRHEQSFTNFSQKKKNSASSNYEHSNELQKINQFKLYPIYQGTDHYTQEITQSQNSANRNIQYINYNVQPTKRVYWQLQKQKVHPFQQTKQTNHYHQEPYNNYYQSNLGELQQQRRYQYQSNFRYQRGNKNDEYHQRLNEISRYHQNENINGTRFGDQVPIYKQAIGIAFYYRNLLEKVFRGFTNVINNGEKLRTLQSQREIPKEEQKTNRMERLKQGFMKIQLFSTNKKIRAKYDKFNNNKNIQA